MRSVSVAKALAAALLLQQASIGIAAPYRPIEPWNVNYGQTACSASRAYGSKQDPVVFALRPSPVGKVVQMILVRSGPGLGPEHIGVVVTIAGKRLETTALRHQAGEDKKSAMIRINFPREALDPIRDSAVVGIGMTGLSRSESFAVPGVAAVLAALDKCNSDLQAYWNIGEERTAALRTPATPVQPLASYVSSKDYPWPAGKRGLGGTTRVTLMVDETGVLKDCMAEATSGIASLDAQTCIILLERARFRPATDSSGKPVRSVLSTAIRWVMP